MGLSAITTVTPDVIATAELSVETPGEGFLDITADIRQFIANAGAQDGTAMLFLRHTSASLTIQENADPDVLRDLVSALRHLAPRDFGWVHDSEGPDDMPAHVRTMLTGVSLQIPGAGWTAAARHLAGHLPDRAPGAAAPAADRAAICRQQALTKPRQSSRLRRKCCKLVT